MGSGPRSSGDAAGVRYAVDEATVADIGAHLLRCDRHFVPRLSQRVDIAAYAAKLREAAVTFEAWDGATLVGLVAAYLNDPGGEAGFVTSVSVEAGFQGEGIGDALMHNCVDRARSRGFKRVGLEVGAANEKAIGLYRRHGFEAGGTTGEFLKMTRELEGRVRRGQ
jgi:ribosomal-protein-alanine N-acetyltransferase